MTKNVGPTDRTIRIVLAVLFVFLITTGATEGAIAWILGILAVTLVATSFVSWCPLYAPFKISTVKRNSPATDKSA